MMASACIQIYFFDSRAAAIVAFIMWIRVWCALSQKYKCDPWGGIVKSSIPRLTYHVVIAALTHSLEPADTTFLTLYSELSRCAGDVELNDIINL